MTKCLVLMMAFIVTAKVAGARTVEVRPSSVMDQLLACRTISASADRLACFDRASTAVDNALRQHELTLIDRQNLERSRRAMFGLSSPDQKILARAAGPAHRFTQQDGVIRSVSPATYGHYLMTLGDGAVWRNVDLLDYSPSVGATVHIEKTAFGAYLLKMPEFVGVHAVRVR